MQRQRTHTTVSKKPTKTSWIDPNDAPDLATPEWREKFAGAGKAALNPVERAVFVLLRARRLGTEEAKAEADLALGDLTREQLREVLARAQQAQAAR
jgi:hypothetical protein